MNNTSSRLKRTTAWAIGVTLMVVLASAAFGEESNELLENAKAGDVDAQVGIAASYSMSAMFQQFTDPGSAQDKFSKAVKWYRKAAEQGDARAEYHLGGAYHDGKGVDQNYKEARGWYRKAAEKNHENAQFQLGTLYYFGEGGTQDYILAHMWMNLARAHGYDDSLDTFTKLTARMTNEQIAEAQRMATEWQEKNSGSGN